MTAQSFHSQLRAARFLPRTVITARTLPARAIWLGLCAALFFVVTRPDVLNVTHDAIERVVALLR